MLGEEGYICQLADDPAEWGNEWEDMGSPHEEEGGEGDGFDGGWTPGAESMAARSAALRARWDPKPDPGKGIWDAVTGKKLDEAKVMKAREE